LLLEEKEYNEYAKRGMPPVVLLGDKARKVNKIFVDMTGGTEGPEAAIEKLAEVGVGTIVGMHFSDKLRKKASESHINVVIAGHMASDAIGMNLLLDKLENSGVKIIATSGLMRVKRA